MLRVIDTGIRTGRENVAFDQALIEAHAARRAPDTLRFLRFRPCALVGLHQILSHEVRVEFCRRHGIEVGRRITGGGGLYLDEGQLGWELVLDRRALGTTDLAAIAERICGAAALGLRALGVPAQFRPRNDIEIDGRKISGTGGFIDGATLFYQGTLLVDFDAARMIEALKVPAEKLAKRDLDDARRRVVTLREVLGRVPGFGEVQAALLEGFRQALGVDPQWGPISDYEEALARRLHASEFGTDAFVASLDAPETDDTLVSTTLTRRGGTLRADIRLEGPRRERVREALITGDFFMTPPRALYDLEATLRGRHVSEAGAEVEAFFARRACDAIGLAPGDFRDLVEGALSQLGFRAAGRRLRGHWRGPGPEAAPTLVFLHDALGCARLWRDIPERLAQASGCGALIYDRWGSGDSEPLAPPYARGYLLDEALVALPEVLAQARVREAVLIGHSDGAAIALAYAGAHPQRVRGVIALAPHLYREARTLHAIDAQIADFRDGDLRARLRRYHGAKTETLFARLVETWTAGAPGEGWGLEPQLRGVTCPVLALQGEDDEFFSAAQLEALAALLPGRVQTLRIPQCGHYPQHQARKPVLAAMAAFLGALGLPHAAGAAPLGAAR
ncbi:MAG: alpha/beta fold hydrolase [Burkholderiales bacterium]|nr:alpha/beta fold hydrolase [Burkholderiales bacterium]